MRILVAPQELKGSLTAAQAARAIATGLGPLHTVEIVPLADGGPGTVHAIVDAAGGHFHEVTVHDPLGRLIPAHFGVIGGRLGILEMAAASGLSLLTRPERNARLTSTFGTGELLRAALDRGLKRIVIGAGGSATNDGGSGALRALGLRCLDQTGGELPLGGAALLGLESLDPGLLDPRLREVELTVATDVTNPLLGPHGATRVFGPQKGANPAALEELEAALARYAAVVARTVGRDVSKDPGTGAAGGFAFGMRAFLGANLVSGFEMVSEATSLPEKLAAADLVITAEGRFDSQTAHGKGPMRLAQMARAAGKKVVLFAGDVVHGTDVSAFDQAIAVSPEARPATSELAFERLRASVERWSTDARLPR